MDMIVAKARMSKTTIYSRFPNKAALFEAVVTDHVERKFDTIEALADARLGLRDQLLLLGQAFVDAATEPEARAIDRIVMAEAPAFPALASRLHRAGYARSTAMVRRLLAAANARNPTVGAEAFYSLLALIPMRTLLIDRDAAPPDVERIVDFVLLGSGVP